jgi:hypothetical protein
MKQAVTVYGASSPQIDKSYIDTAFALGQELARNGLTVVCGGGKTGLMAAAIEGAASVGGKSIGVIPSFMVERHWNHPQVGQLIETDSMHSRKETMASLARAAIALPGGCGTLEELLEIITWRQLGLFQGHVIILNINGYYDPLLAMLQRSIDQHFMNPDHSSLWHVTTSVEEAVEIALRPIQHKDFTQKIV